MWDQAREWAEQARRAAPDHPAIPLVLGIAALNQNRLPEARILLQDAVAADPESVFAWSSLGLVFARLGDPGGAIIAWERTLQLNPQFNEAKYNLGLAHARLGHSLEAIAYLEDFAASAPEGPPRQQAIEIVGQLRSSRSR
jgi:tetratricopeptide (TPR) repeat protein